MSLNNILYTDNPSPSWVSLRTYAITNDTTINSTDLNVSGTITAGTFSFTNLTLDNLIVNDTITTNDLIVNNNATIQDLTVNNLIGTYDLSALHDITAPNILASTVINTPDLIATGTIDTTYLNVTNHISSDSIDNATLINTNDLIAMGTIDTTYLNVTNHISSDSIDNTTLINTTDLTATGTMTCQSSFTVFTDTANIHNSLNTAKAVHLNVTSTATLPPISFLGSSTNFSFDSITFNVTFTMYTFLAVSQGTKNTTIRYTTFGNTYCITVNISTIIASADYQYFECPNPGIVLPIDFAYCPMIILDNNQYFNGFMSISPTGIIKIFKNANNDNFGAITALIPYNTCFYSII